MISKLVTLKEQRASSPHMPQATLPPAIDIRDEDEMSRFRDKLTEMNLRLTGDELTVVQLRKTRSKRC